MTRSRIIQFGTLVLTTILLALTARAAETESRHAPPKAAAAAPPVQRLGGVGAWNAYLYKEKSGRVCYLAGGPKKTEPAHFRRRPPSAMVTHRPQENVADVISFNEGAPLKEGSDVSLEVDGTHFDLFTKGDTAWSRTSDLDRTIVAAMAKGRQAILRAVPQKGPPVIDTYSLSGFAQTLALIDKACGVKR
ncbi:MAG TPA: invasion associated locus B family protein [Stellaceae bacterium]